MNYILEDLVASACPLIGVAIGIKEFYKYLKGEYLVSPLNDGRNISTFVFVAMMATLVTGIITELIFKFNIHMGIIELFIPELATIVVGNRLLNYVVKVGVTCLLEKFVAILAWNRCKTLLIDEII